MNPIELPRAMVPLTTTAQAWACSSVDYLKSSLSHIGHTPEDLMPLHLALAYCESHGEKTKAQILTASIARCFLNMGVQHGQVLKDELAQKDQAIRELIDTNTESLAMVVRHQKLLKKLAKRLKPGGGN